MEQRGLKGVLALGLLAAASSCASGDGVPKATIENGLDTCIVEASFLEYGFTDPIGPSGRMSSREVIVGSDVAYAITMTPMSGETCVDLGLRKGGTLWVTNAQYSTEPGQTTRIRFAPDTAFEVPIPPPGCGTEASRPYVEGLRRFSRLTNYCDPDAGTAPQDAGTD